MSAEVQPYANNGALQGSEFGAVIALGKNWRLPITGEENIELSIESKMNTLAGAQKIVDGDAGLLILSTGRTAGKDKFGNDYPPESEKMYEFMRRFYTPDQIPDENIILQSESFDTAGDAEEVKKILDQNNIENPELVTVGTHLRRARRLFRNYGVNLAKSTSSEDVLRNRSSHFDRLLKRYSRSFRHVKEIFKEAIGTFLVYTIDPKGTRIVRRMSSRTRSRQDSVPVFQVMPA